MQENLHDMWQAILNYWFLIAAITTTFIMALIRTAKKNGKIDYLESIMCALFTYGIWFILTWLNLPESMGVLIGGLIGFKGTTITSKWIGKKLGIDLEEKE